MAVRLRRQFLKLLDEDKEFRYTVAGYLGLGEILKRLDSIEENIRKIWEEIRGLREGQERLWEAQNRLWEEVKAKRGTGKALGWAEQAVGRSQTVT
jgi:hypothetical protein